MKSFTDFRMMLKVIMKRSVYTISFVSLPFLLLYIENRHGNMSKLTFIYVSSNVHECDVNSLFFSLHQLKLRSKVSTEQEKLLAGKGREMEEIRKSLAETQSSLRMKENEVCLRNGILSLFHIDENITILHLPFNSDVDVKLFFVLWWSL